MIGLFDSGSGVLTVLTALRKRMPEADVVYFGDIKNAPYGERRADELALLTEKGLRLLVDKGATQFVSACNSVSTAVLMGAAGGNLVIEMTRPTARALRAHAGAKMLLIATPATISSQIYRNAIGVTVQLDELPIPKLAGAIEFGAPTQEIPHIVREAFTLQQGKKYDGVMLGCTHYPLVRNVIEDVALEVFGISLIIDPAEAVAEEVTRRFDVQGSGSTKFFISK